MEQDFVRLGAVLHPGDRRCVVRADSNVHARDQVRNATDRQRSGGPEAGENIFIFSINYTGILYFRGGGREKK